MNENWETSDNYPGEIVRDDRHRVIGCKGGIQWVLQRDFSGPERLRGTKWRAIAYCTTRNALTRRWREETGSSSPVLDALPERFGEADNG